MPGFLGRGFRSRYVEKLIKARRISSLLIGALRSPWGLVRFIPPKARVKHVNAWWPLRKAWTQASWMLWLSWGLLSLGAVVRSEVCVINYCDCCPPTSDVTAATSLLSVLTAPWGKAMTVVTPCRTAEDSAQKGLSHLMEVTQLQVRGLWFSSHAWFSQPAMLSVKICCASWVEGGCRSEAEGLQNSETWLGASGSTTVLAEFLPVTQCSGGFCLFSVHISLLVKIFFWRALYIYNMYARTLVTDKLISHIVKRFQRPHYRGIKSRTLCYCFPPLQDTVFAPVLCPLGNR